MINAERYEQIISELKENIDDKLKTLKLIEELGETREVYKRSLVCDNYIKVGRLTTRDEIILDDPIHSSLDNSLPINHYHPGWYIKYKCDDHYSLIDKFPVKEMEEISITGGVIGYSLPTKPSSWTHNRASTIVFYDQYKTGDEKALVLDTNPWHGMVILMPDGTRTEIPIPTKKFR